MGDSGINVYALGAINCLEQMSQQKWKHCIKHYSPYLFVWYSAVYFVSVLIALKKTRYRVGVNASMLKTRVGTQKQSGRQTETE